MDEVFGDSTGIAKADLERQNDIQRRLGLLEDAVKERSSGSVDAEKQSE